MNNTKCHCIKKKKLKAWLYGTQQLISTICLNATYFPHPLLERGMREIVLVPVEDYGKTRSRLYLIFIEILLLEISNIKGEESAKSAFFSMIERTPHI